MTLRYAQLVIAGREPRYLGHNPLGGWMIVALLGCALLAAASGWLYTTDRFWGVAWVEALPEGWSNLLFVLAGLQRKGIAIRALMLRCGE